MAEVTETPQVQIFDSKKDNKQTWNTPVINKDVFAPADPLSALFVDPDGGLVKGAQGQPQEHGKLAGIAMGKKREDIVKDRREILHAGYVRLFDSARLGYRDGGLAVEFGPFEPTDVQLAAVSKFIGARMPQPISYDFKDLGVVKTQLTRSEWLDSLYDDIRRLKLQRKFSPWSLLETSDNQTKQDKEPFRVLGSVKKLMDRANKKTQLPSG